MAKPDPSMDSKFYVLRQFRQDMKNEDEMEKKLIGFARVRSMFIMVRASKNYIFTYEFYGFLRVSSQTMVGPSRKQDGGGN